MHKDENKLSPDRGATPESAAAAPENAEKKKKHKVRRRILIALGVLLLSLGEQDFETNFTATLACLSNIGPGLGKVGPTANYGFYSSASKILLSFEMLAGRLELFPIIILFSPATYRRVGK